jgi:Spy/CpxP family protein refolding chaperone
MKRCLSRWSFVVLLGIAAIARAQMPGPPPGPKAPPPPAFLDQLFVPELIMRHQAEIALTSEQRDSITQAMTEAQRKLVELQWQFESASKKLGEILGSATIDEASAAAEADRLLNVETQMKRVHLGLLVRIKNILTAAQHAKLRELRVRESRPGPPPPR